jgi:type IV secretion system protein VirB3
MNRLEQTPLYRALYRPNLFLGGERELVMSTGIACAGLIISSQNWPSLIAGLAVWFGFIGLFRLMAKRDPHMVRVYLCYVQYQSYYPAHPTIWCED